MITVTIVFIDFDSSYCVLKLLAYDIIFYSIYFTLLSIDSSIIWVGVGQKLVNLPNAVTSKTVKTTIPNTYGRGSSWHTNA